MPSVSAMDLLRDQAADLLAERSALFAYLPLTASTMLLDHLPLY